MTKYGGHLRGPGCVAREAPSPNVQRDLCWMSPLCNLSYHRSPPRSKRDEMPRTWYPNMRAINKKHRRLSGCASLSHIMKSMCFSHASAAALGMDGGRLVGRSVGPPLWWVDWHSVILLPMFITPHSSGAFNRARWSSSADGVCPALMDLQGFKLPSSLEELKAELDICVVSVCCNAVSPVCALNSICPHYKTHSTAQCISFLSFCLIPFIYSLILL